MSTTTPGARTFTRQDAPTLPGVRRVRIADGRAALIRPARAEDRPLLVAALDALSPRSRYQRFHTPVPRLPARDLDRLMDLDATHQFVLHAFDESGTSMVGVGRCVFTSPHECELAITVGDCWQRQGLGRTLLDSLIEAARERGVSRLTGDALSENRAIAALLRSRGFQRSGRVSVTTVWAREL